MLIKASSYAVKILPDTIAFQITRALAAMTHRIKASPAERQAIAQSTQSYFGKGGRNVARSWGREGPLVVLVHGWGGSGAQMAPLAAHLAQGGFRCVVPDIRGHGDSPLRHTSWTYLIEDVADLSRSLNEEVYAYVAHSAGALTVMAGRTLKGIHAKRYVCICAPSHPFPPINVVEKKLSPRKRVVDRYRQYIAAQFETTWESMQTGVFYSGAGSDTLLFYDETDRFVPHSEGDKIHAICRGSRLIKTSGYSHAKILAAPELAWAVDEFLGEDQRVRASRSGGSQ
jgi:pimeloyl-ACP methyl ester carboxylesterase